MGTSVHGNQWIFFAEALETGIPELRSILFPMQLEGIALSQKPSTIPKVSAYTGQDSNTGLGSVLSYSS